MTTVDVFENIYRLKDEYTPNANKIVAATDRVTRAVSAMSRALLSPMGLAGALAGGGGLLAIGGQALRAAADFEQMKVTLEALTGSSEQAAQKLKFMQELAIPSTFTFSQLAEAGTELEAFGLRIERVLPLIAKLGGAFKADEEHIRMMVRMFGELSAGKMPELEQMTAFGLNRQQFAAKGVQFSNQGQLLSTPLQAMNALEAIINEKYGNILDKMAGTTNAKLTSLADAWQRSLKKIGDVLAVYVNPMLDKLTSVIDKLATSGQLEQWVIKIGKSFRFFAEGVKIAVGAMAAFTALQAINGMVTITRAVIALGQALAAAGSAAAVLQMILSRGAAFLPILAALAIGGIAYAGASKLFSDIESQMQSLLKGSSSAAGMPAGAGQGSFSEKGDQALNYQGQIAANTRTTAENTRKMIDFKRFALGGGQLGEIGVTPSEFYRNRNGVTLRFEGRTSLEQAIAEIVNDAILGLRRQGAI